MAFTEQELIDAFGLGGKAAEKPDAEAAPGSEADPSEGSGAAGGAIPEGVDGSIEGADVALEDGVIEGADTDGDAARQAAAGVPGDVAQSGRAAGEGQTGGQRRENADKRKRYEEVQAAKERAAVEKAVAEAVAAERERAQTELAGFFASAQLQNSLTGTPISSMDDFRAWEKAYRESQLRQDLQAGMLTPETLERAISESPTMKRAEEALRQNEEAARQRGMAESRARVDAELAEIRKLDPSVTTVESIIAMPTGQAFYEAVKNGNTFLNAFKLANFERLTSTQAAGAAAAARQQALSNAGGKDHLNASAKPRGGGSVVVPPEEMKLARALMPGKSEAQIRDYYNKHARG